ncbi:MAG TPA: hypothetical protein V6C63_17650 [Allocoleopsis sp.]
MTLEEFKKAYLEAQNGLGNDLQALIDLSSDLSQLAAVLSELAETVRQDYERINRVVEEFIQSQEQP